jgi:nucleoside recognition membrane protein YjiH
LAQYVKSLGVKTIDSHGLETELKNSAVTIQDIKRKASFVTSLQRKELTFGVILGILVSLITNLIFANFYAILTSTEIPRRNKFAIIFAQTG